MNSTRSRMRRILQTSSVVAALALLAACTNTSEASDSGVKLTFIAPDKALTAATAPYTSVPLQAGYFESEGLDVTIQPVDTALSAVQAISTGQGFMTYASLNAAVSAAEKDPNLRIIGLTNGNIFRVIVPESSPIRSVADLKGKKIGANTLASASALYVKGMLKLAGFDPEKDASYYPVGLGAQAADAMRKGTIDAYAGWDAPNLVIAELLNTKMREIPSQLNDVTGTSVLLVNRDSLEKHPEWVAGMARAFFKAMVFSMENPEAAIRMHWKQFPQSKSTQQSEEEALREGMETIRKRMELTGGPASTGKFGEQPIAEVQRTIDLFVEVGMLTTHIDLSNSELIDYSQVESYNKFDIEEIKRQAREWKN